MKIEPTINNKESRVSGKDHLGFLYSNAGIQSCIQLDEAARFIGAPDSFVNYSNLTINLLSCQDFRKKRMGNI